MEIFALGDLRGYTSELVRNAENGQGSVVSEHGKPLFVALPLNDALLQASVNVALADKMVMTGEVSVAAGARLACSPARLRACSPHARCMQHLSAMGDSMLDETAEMASELASLQKHLGPPRKVAARSKTTRAQRNLR